jgi:hypothetical protein
MLGTKLKSLEKDENKSEWVQSNPQMDTFTYRVDFDPWKEHEFFLKQHFPVNVNRMLNKKQQNAMINDRKSLQTTEYFTMFKTQ